MVDAPLCFGAITVFAVGSTRCEACSFSSQCSATVQENIAKASVVLDVESFMNIHRKITGKKPPKPVEALDSGGLVTQGQPVQEKAPKPRIQGEMKQALLELTGGLKVDAFVARLLAGENPHDKVAAPIPWLVSVMLINGLLTKQRLDEALIKLGAPVERRIVYAKMLVATGIANLVDDQFKLKGKE